VVVEHVFARLQRRGEPPAQTVVGVIRLFWDWDWARRPPMGGSAPSTQLGFGLLFTCIWLRSFAVVFRLSPFVLRLSSFAFRLEDYGPPP
jgi:hypothetical protein